MQNLLDCRVETTGSSQVSWHFLPPSHCCPSAIFLRLQETQVMFLPRTPFQRQEALRTCRDPFLRAGPGREQEEPLEVRTSSRSAAEVHAPLGLREAVTSSSRNSRSAA